MHGGLGLELERARPFPIIKLEHELFNYSGSYESRRSRSAQYYVHCIYITYIVLLLWLCVCSRGRDLILRLGTSVWVMSWVYDATRYKFPCHQQPCALVCILCFWFWILTIFGLEYRYSYCYYYYFKVASCNYRRRNGKGKGEGRGITK